MSKITLSPVTRVSGLLSVDLYPGENGIVEEANCSGEQFRGFELMLKGRVITDAVYFTQRICGICSMAHGYTAARLVAQIYGLQLTPEIRLLQQIMFGAEFLQNHIRHFYLLALPDYLDTALPQDAAASQATENHEASRFSPYQQEVFREHTCAALEFSRKCHEILAVLGGKIPHQHGLVAEGVAVALTADRRVQIMALLSQVRQFIDGVMLPDTYQLAEVYADYYHIGIRPNHYLSFGIFESDLGGHFPSGVYLKGALEAVDVGQIQESIRFSWYGEQNNQTIPEPDKPGAYSWVKAPRYQGLAVEGGPLARKAIRNRGIMEHANGVMARLVARTEEAALIAAWMQTWLDQIGQVDSFVSPLGTPRLTEAFQLNDAPRGALLHWMIQQETTIVHYNIITPTTWNFSPKDDTAKRGPVEEALVGTAISPECMAAPGRVIRSFDPCLNCAAQVIDQNRKPRMQMELHV